MLYLAQQFRIVNISRLSLVKFQILPEYPRTALQLAPPQAGEHWATLVLPRSRGRGTLRSRVEGAKREYPPLRPHLDPNAVQL